MTLPEKNTTPMMAQYEKIKQEHPGFLMFYRLGDFYELFGDDALVASKALDIALTQHGKGENATPMCGVPFHAYESYLSKLIKCGYKVAICEQTEDPKEAKKRGAKSVVQREVIRLVTGGTLTESNLLEEKKNNYILSFCKVNNVLGLAWIDLSCGLFFTQEINLEQNKEVSALSSCLSRLLPMEILISDTYLQNPDIFALLRNWEQKLSVLPAARFNSESAQKALKNFFSVQTLDSFGNFSRAEIAAAGTLLSYVENTQKGKIPCIEKPCKIKSSNIMEIDAATRRNLEILEPCSVRGSCLLETIDYTVTGAGGRMLARRLSAPLTDLVEINNRLDVIEFFLNNFNICRDIRELLQKMPEIERAVSRLAVGRGGPRDLKGLALALSLIPKLKNIVHLSGENAILNEIPASLNAILNNLGNYNNLTSNILSALRDENDRPLPMLARDGNFIRSGYSPALDEIRDIKSHASKYIAELQQKYIEQTKIAGLKIKYNTLIGYFIEVPTKSSTELLDNPEFIYRQSVLNATRFTTVELTEIDNKISSSAEKELAFEQEIFDNLVRDVLLVSDNILQTAKAVAEIDIACGFATLAAEKKYCRPVLDNSLCFEIEEGRHPVVEKALEDEHAGSFIANSCHLDGNSDALWLLTGPNMAGKSTFLRQNAIIAIMAQTGAYVPCKSAHIGLINKLFSRVGASDDLARGRSTFMVEMVETASILNQADERSFVILDEIGRGTATFDGLSIAWAVMEHLHNINRSRAIFATHYHELTALSQKLVHTSRHCTKIKEFNDEVVFLHEIVDGTADRSYGIHVAKLAGLPKSVLKRAEQVLAKLEDGNKQKSSLCIEDDLPLFTASYAQKPEQKEDSKLEKAVKELNPDDFSPREALEKLYELKQLYDEE